MMAKSSSVVVIHVFREEVGALAVEAFAAKKGPSTARRAGTTNHDHDDDEKERIGKV
jgi:hypothetical protein